MRRQRLVLCSTLALVIFLASGCGGGGGSTRGAGQAGETVAKVVFKRFASVADNTDDFARIFGRKPTAAQARDLSQVRSKAVSSGFTILRAANAASEANTFLSQYRASSNEIYTLVGHNAEGLFRFADGSELNLRALGQENQTSIVAAISCDSARYAQGQAVGIATAVTYEVAYRTEERFRQNLQRFVDGGGVVVVAEAQRQLDAALGEVVREMRLQNIYKTSIGVGGTVAGVGIYQRL